MNPEYCVMCGNKLPSESGRLYCDLCGIKYGGNVLDDTLYSKKLGRREEYGNKTKPANRKRNN